MDGPRNHNADCGSNEARARGLFVLDGEAAGSCLSLKAPVTLLGSAPACDIRIVGQSLRSLHCLMVPHAETVSIRFLHADGGAINGTPASTAEMVDGDVLEIGGLRYRLDWPAIDAARPDDRTTQDEAAATIARQAALNEQEIQLADRSAALAQQESQLAGRLEDQRRELLDLQDQITAARVALRQERADHAALVEEQQRELSSAREAAAEQLRCAKVERERLLILRRRMIQRGRKHWQSRRKANAELEARLQQQADQIAADKSTLAEHREQCNGQIELDKRRLKDAWDRLHESQREWQAKRAQEESIVQERTRDLARRAKAVAAGEQRLNADRGQMEREQVELRKELEQLETRIANSRALLLRVQPEPFKLAPPGVPMSAPPATPIALPPSDIVKDLEQREAALERRAEALSRVAGDLNDQRMHLTEQAERLVRTQQQWHSDRNEALRDLETIGLRFQARELDLDRRVRELGAARLRLQAEYESVTQSKLKLEAEQARRASTNADRRAELDARWAELDVRERALKANEQSWKGLLQLWGRRRWREVLQLRTDQDACRQERCEWMNARRIWLRAAIKLRAERRTVAAQALALEQWRKEHVSPSERPAAAKRLERLERQWASQCAIAARELERFQDLLTVEATRLDELAVRLKRDALDAAARLTTMDQRANELERERQALSAEQERMAAQMDLARIRWEAAERRALDLRDEVERVARLLIDSGPVLALPTGQAA